MPEPLRPYVDQMLRLDVAQALRNEGYDVIRASEVGQARADDAEILEPAISEDRIFVTLDKDSRGRRENGCRNSWACHAATRNGSTFATILDSPSSFAFFPSVFFCLFKENQSPQPLEKLSEPALTKFFLMLNITITVAGERPFSFYQPLRDL